MLTLDCDWIHVSAALATGLGGGSGGGVSEALEGGLVETVAVVSTSMGVASGGGVSA